MQSPVTQLLLPLTMPDEFTLDTFCGEKNQLLVSILRNALQTPQGYLYCWGPSGSGRTHLLRALCSAGDAQGRSCCYIPLAELSKYSIAYFENLENFSVLAVDHIEAIAADPLWERALFHLYNRIQDRGRSLLIVGGNAPVKQLDLTLPDLTSRLAWGASYRIEALTEEERLDALQQRAKIKGFELSEEVGRFLLCRLHRDMHTLFNTLHRLDHASMREQRKLTIPFVKSILSL